MKGEQKNILNYTVSSRNLASTGQSRCFLTSPDGQVSIVCHRRLRVLCCPGLRLQPLPFHSSTHSRIRTAKSSCLTYQHVASPLALLLDKPLAADGLEPALAGSLAGCDEEPHSILVVFPTDRNHRAGWCVGTSIYFQASFQSVAVWHFFFFFFPSPWRRIVARQ